MILNELLKLTETISSTYGLRLNRNKCVVIQMNNGGLVHFADNEPLPKNMEATYLGNENHNEANIKHEILNKMQKLRKTWFKLLPYWKATNANVKWQLLIFDAIVSAIQVAVWSGDYSIDKGHAKKKCLPDTVLEENPQNSANFHR